MSWQSTAWSVTLKPERLQGVSDAAHITLCLLANRADERGRGVFYSLGAIAKMRGLTTRTIQRHMVELAEAGLITHGDQRLVQHIPSNRRPTVWNLCHRPIGELGEDLNLGVTHLSPQDSTPVDNYPSRGDTSVTPEGVRGDMKPPLGVTPGVVQDVSNTSTERVTYLGTESDADLSTGAEVTTTSRPDRECVHDFPARFIIIRKTGQSVPECPYCRRTKSPEVITLKPLEIVHA